MGKRLVLAAVAVAAVAAIGLGVATLVGAMRPAPRPSATAPDAAAVEEGALAFLAVPRPLPPLVFRDGSGRPLTLADFRGRTVLLNLWATWCVPCRKEMPTLDRLEARLGGGDFQVVALSIDRAGPAAVKAFLKTLGLSALGVYDDASGKAAGSLGVVGIPTTLLVGRDGRELGRKVGPAAWDDAESVALIRRALAGPPVAAAGTAGSATP